MTSETAAANHIYESYSADYAMRIHFAMRQDRQWFKRLQTRHPKYGYTWTRWKNTPEPAPDRFLSATGRAARLPKGNSI